MALYRRVFSIEDIAQVHKQFVATIKAFTEAEAAWARIGRPGVAAASVRTLQAAYFDFNRSLDVLAERTAADAKARILQLLHSRQLRPNTQMGPHLRGAIMCRPIKDFGTLGTGEVGIADIGVLDRVVNQFGPQYGPYWRAIEEGTLHQRGRQIYGAFFGPGLGSGPFAPDPGQAGKHPIFVTSAQGAAAFGDLGHSGGFGPKGGQAGRRMTIGREIAGQHFIRDGANAVEIEWRAGVARVQAEALRRIAAVTKPLP